MRKPQACAHRFVNGDSCSSPAMQGDTHCYYHQNYKAARDAGDPNYELPLLEDKQSVQLVVRDIMRGIISGKLDSRKSSQLLYATQIVSNNLARWEMIDEENEGEDDEEDQEPIMIKLLREGLGNARIASGPDAGRPFGDVLAEEIQKMPKK